MRTQFVHMVMLGCSNMGIVVAFAKLFEVCMQDIGDFCVKIFNLICLY
jgi:hypothetical protein